MNGRLRLKNLTPKIGTWDGMPGGFGNLSQSDIAAALGTVSNETATLLVRVKYALQLSFESKLGQRWRQRVIWIAGKRRWRGQAKQFYALADRALKEFLWAKCRVCKGRGVLYNRQGVQRECESCNGKGDYNPVGRDRARAIGIDESSYRENWASRFDILRDDLADLEREAVRAMNRYLSEID